MGVFKQPCVLLIKALSEQYVKISTWDSLSQNLRSHIWKRSFEIWSNSEDCVLMVSIKRTNNTIHHKTHRITWWLRIWGGSVLVAEVYQLLKQTDFLLLLRIDLLELLFNRLSMVLQDPLLNFLTYGIPDKAIKPLPSLGFLLLPWRNNNPTRDSYIANCVPNWGQGLFWVHGW